jgi:predicted acetyltransferase
MTPERIAASTLLCRPTPALLPGFVAALERGWSADNIRGAVAARETLERIRSEPEVFFLTTEDPQALGPPVTVADGTQRPRIPGLARWIWDAADPGPGGFAGSINLRWMPGHAELPPHVLGHVGYAVVPWQRQRGHATRALGLMLAVARGHGMPFVELTTDVDNEPSQRVITANGGEPVGTFDKGPVYGHQEGLRYRIPLG